MARDKTHELVHRSYERTFRAGSSIFEEGDPGRALFVIQSGEVELSRLGPGGRQRVARLGASDFFGEMSVLVGEPRREHAVARSECRVLEIDGETLEGLCVDRPEMAIRIIQRLTQRVIDGERRLALLRAEDLLRPVVRSLVGDAGGVGPLPGSLRSLARDAGLSLAEAHRALQELLDRKLVRLVDQELQIPDAGRLSACLDSHA